MRFLLACFAMSGADKVQFGSAPTENKRLRRLQSIKGTWSNGNGTGHASDESFFRGKRIEINPVRRLPADNLLVSITYTIQYFKMREVITDTLAGKFQNGFLSCP